MALPSTIYEVQDGDQLLSIRIQKMDVLSAEDFLERMVAALARAGLKIPSSALGGDPDAVGRAISKDTEGFLLQLKDLHFDEIVHLRSQMFKGCYLQKRDDVTGRTIEMPLSDQTIRGNITEVSTIFKIRLEVLKYNFAFLANALKQVGSQAKSRLNSLTTPTSPDLSDSFSQTGSEYGSSASDAPTKML